MTQILNRLYPDCVQRSMQAPGGNRAFIKSVSPDNSNETPPPIPRPAGGNNNYRAAEQAARF
jgi:hypothetical protein